MSDLDDDMERERRHLADLARRARARHAEISLEADALQQKGAHAASQGDTKAASEFERRSQKARAIQRRYADLVQEFEGQPDLLAAEVLLARLQGPEVDLLVGEIERNREEILRRAAALLRTREGHKSLRQRWVELSDKIRTLRESRGLTSGRNVPVDFRVPVTPQTYTQKPDGPTLREVSDLVHQLGL